MDETAFAMAARPRLMVTATQSLADIVEAPSLLLPSILVGNTAKAKPAHDNHE
jgi:hypothetical protein